MGFVSFLGIRDRESERAVNGRLRIGKWYDVRITGIGGTYTLYLDGARVVQMQHGRFRVGRMGMGTRRCAASFDDIKVARPTQR